MVVDHKHRKKSEPIGIDGKGLVRGVIHRQANSMEGQIRKSWVRHGMHKFDISLPAFLRNLADYLENPPLKKYRLIHPLEKTPIKKLTKSSYNKLKRAVGTTCKMPPFRAKRKSKHVQTLTKPLAVLFVRFKITPTYYKP